MKLAGILAAGVASLLKLNPADSGVRNEKSCGDGERKRPIVVPLIVGLVPIRVDPLAIVVAVRVEHVRIAVRMCEAPSIPPPIESFSELYRIRDRNQPALRTKYLHFFEASAYVLHLQP